MCQNSTDDVICCWSRVWLTGPHVLSFAGYVLGVTMTVIIIAIGVGIVLGYTYKRWVVSFPNSHGIGLRKRYSIRPSSWCLSKGSTVLKEAKPVQE